MCPTYYYYFSFPQTTFIAPSTYMYFRNIKAYCMLFEFIDHIQISGEKTQENI